MRAPFNWLDSLSLPNLALFPLPVKGRHGWPLPHLPFAILRCLHSNLIHFNVHVAYRNRRYTAPEPHSPATAHFTNAILEQRLKYTTGQCERWARTV